MLAARLHHLTLQPLNRLALLLLPLLLICMEHCINTDRWKACSRATLGKILNVVPSLSLGLTSFVEFHLPIKTYSLYTRRSLMRRWCCSPAPTPTKKLYPLYMLRPMCYLHQLLCQTVKGPHNACSDMHVLLGIILLVYYTLL